MFQSSSPTWGFRYCWLFFLWYFFIDFMQQASGPLELIYLLWQFIAKNIKIIIKCTIIMDLVRISVAWRCNVFLISRHINSKWIGTVITVWRYVLVSWRVYNDAWKLQNLHRAFSELQNIYSSFEICRICTCLKIARKLLTWKCRIYIARAFSKLQNSPHWFLAFESFFLENCRIYRRR